MYIAIKVLITSLVIVGASELAKKWSLASTLLLALPFTSLLAIMWVYLESRDTTKVAAMSWGVFWLVPPSLVFFPILSLLLERGTNFYLALVCGIVVALITYIVYAKILGMFGINV